MWIRVALDKNAVHYGNSPEYTYVDGENIKEFYFGDETAKALEEDGFLSEKVRESLIVVNDTESLFSRLDNERVTLPDKLK